MFEFIQDFKPDIIDIPGDLTDFWQISKFSVDPTRSTTLQKDINETKKYLFDLRAIAPEAEIELQAGNHMDRLRKYMWDKAKELNCLDSLDLKFLLGLDDLKISFIESAEGYRQRGKLIITHGTCVSQDSGMTARRNLQKYGLSVLCGHTHRGGSTYKTDLLGTRGAWENFCLCDFKLAQVWRMGICNWQTGFSYVYYYPDRFEIHQCIIIDNKFTALGKEYR